MEIGKLVLEIRVSEAKLPKYKLHVKLCDGSYVTVNGDYLRSLKEDLVIWEGDVVAGIFAAGKWLSIVRGDAIPEKEEAAK